jgi:hypothetical protein
MAEITYTIDVSHALKTLDGLKLEQRQRAAMDESLGYLQSEVRAGMPLDNGIARGSVFPDIRGTPVNLRGIVASPLPYVAVLEKGRRPGATPPPTGPIAKWLSRNGGDAKLAFVVARSIGRRGTKAHKMFKNAIERGGGRVESIFQRHFNL